MKIAILSDSPFIKTGYSNQAKQLARHLKDKGHEIIWFANAYIGETLDYAKLEDGTVIDFKVLGSAFGQDYFRATLSQYLKKYKIDRLIILLDTFMLYPWLLDLDLSPAKVFFWFPSDGGGGMPKGCDNILRKVDVPVAMAKFGQRQVKDYYNINSAYIPHGLNSSMFKPLPIEEIMKLKAQWNVQGKFVIGVVARNQPRKNLDRTIKMMALLKDKLPNAVLLLHMDANDPAQQMFNIPALIQKYGLENRIIFTGMTITNGFSTEKLNELYNVFDVFLLTTSGEGFGIPIIEAMACGVPVLATDYTTTQELVKDTQAGLSINLSGCEPIDWNKKAQEVDLDCLDGTITGSWEVERGMCSIVDCVDKLVYLNNNPVRRNEMGRNGRLAVLEEYDFNKVGKKWEEVLK